MNKSALPLLLFILVVSICHAQIIIDHRNTDITSLSEADITAAKQTLHIVYGHTSHGSQLISGMNGLVGFANGGGKGMSFPDDIFAFNYDGWDGALDLRDGDGLPDDVGYYPAWYNASRSYLTEADNLTRNVMMWSWCGQVDDKYATGTLYSEYLQPMGQLEADYPNVKFVYMTGHLDHWDEANNKAANDSIRRYCQRNKKILYDFADIESYNPDGTFFEFASDDCSYYNSDGNYQGNWAIEWRESHTENEDWYDCYAAHSDALNGNQKAYAAWALFVEIAKAIKLESIPEDLEVNDTIVSDESNVCFNALNDITVAGSSPVTIENNANATFIAGNSIRFLPGFHAQEGSYVDAHITTTDSFCDDLPAPITAAEPVVEKSTAKPVDEEDQPQRDSRGAAMKVYPNPNNGIFTVQFTNFESNTQVFIFNALGQKVYETMVNGESERIELPNIQRGIYLLKAISKQKKFDRKVLVK